MGLRRWHELALPREPRLRGTLSNPLVRGWLWEGVGEGDRGE